MRFLSRSFSAVIVTFCMTSTLFAQNTRGGENFYEKGREGFYWYQDNLPSGLEEYFREPEPDSFSYADLWRMNPDIFAKVLKDRQSAAIQTPTPANALKYLEAQDVAKRKSMAFAGVIGMVSQIHPEFSEQNLTTMIGPAKKAFYEIKDQQASDTLNFGAEQFALIVFEQIGCSYCEAQRPIIERFQASHGWTVKFLNIDDHKSVAEKHGIEITPSILMVSKSSNKAIQISSGVVSLAELQQSIVRAVRYFTGQNQPEQWFNGAGVLDPLKFVKKGDKNGDKN